jgi:hypothetical protein
MKNLIATIALLGAIQIITPGQPTAYGYVEPNGDFRITQPGVGTSYGYNQGDGVTTILRPGGPTSYVYSDEPKRGRDEGLPVPRGVARENRTR